MSTTLPAITLYFKDGSSDKVYQCHILEQDAAYVVNFAYGRRGSTLKAGTKTTSPVDLASAKKIFDKLVQEKTSKGYSEGESAAPYSASERKLTGYVPQLLLPIEADEANALLTNDEFILQEKFDGERMIASLKDGVVTAANKKGLTKSISSLTEADLKKLKVDVTVDSEAIGDVIYVFDILEFDGVDVRTLPYKERLTHLQTFAKLVKKLTYVKVVATAITTAEKKKLFADLELNKKEGAVFKKLDAVYTPGRPAGKGNQLKYKFYATASVVVARVNDKRSVGMKMLDDTTNAWVDVGNVTISVDKDIPKEGDVIEVRYLYAYKGGSLFQTTFLNVRNDVDQDECVLSQLKYKSE